jgi:hypothetical protein
MSTTTFKQLGAVLSKTEPGQFGLQGARPSQASAFKAEVY